MHKPRRPDSPGRRTRSCSMSTQASSRPGSTIACPPTSINPEPAYIAMSAASQLVSAGLELDGVTIEPSALAQLNSFLDYVLFNLLLVARSTQLALLRPAVHGVLKAKLGKAALAGANEELKEYLGDDDDEEDDQSTDSNRQPGTKRDFDLELAWKLARLRCMVYSRLGDLEEDDEDDYIERENLDERGGRPRRFSSHPSRVTTAAAIFLTSVLEFVAEQALAYATEATHRKLTRAQPGRGPPDPLTSMFFPPDRVVVSDADMRHLGRDSPLQKLWRSWRHQVRPPGDLASRPISPESQPTIGLSRKASFNTSEERPGSSRNQLSVGEVLQDTDPAWVPLPMTANDVWEIEVPDPGSPRHHRFMSQNEEGSDRGAARRPWSLEVPPSPRNFFTGGGADGGTDPDGAISEQPTLSQRRPLSLGDVHRFGSLGAPSLLADRRFARSGTTPVETSDLGVGNENRGGHPEGQPPVGAPVHPSDDAVVAREQGAETPHMPGTFPHGQAVDMNGTPVETSRNVQESLATADEQDRLDGVSALPASGRSLGDSKAPESSPAEVHQPPMAAAGLMSRMHPVRSISKPGAFEAESGPRDSPPPIPDKVPGRPMQSTAFDRPPPPVSPPETMRWVQESPYDGVPTSPIGKTQKRQGQAIFPPETRDMRPGSKSSDHTKSSTSSSKLLGFDRAQQSGLQTGAKQIPTQRFDPDPGYYGGSDAFAVSGNPYGTGDSKTDSRHSRSSSNQGASAGAYSRNITSHDEAARISHERNGTTGSPAQPLYREGTSRSGVIPRNLWAKQMPPSQPVRSRTQDLADFFRETAPPGEKSKLQSGVGSVNGLRSNPPEPTALPAMGSKPSTASRSSGVESTPSPARTARSGKSHHQAREATVGNPGIRDLADFAKSTGPENPGQLPKMVTQDLARPRVIKRATTRSQARDPVIRGSSSDLIDFIRQGPPRGTGDDPRIPRTVAPFRTTMDSDDLDNLSGPAGDVNGRYSASSNLDGSVLTKSTVSSRTGLIDSKGRSGLNPSYPSYLATSQVPKRLGGESMGPPPPPRRKNGKAKDPYAIDPDSDDEIDNGLGGAGRQGGEESLMDFLRNTSPPPDYSQPQPFNLSSNPIPAQVPNMLRRPVAGGFRDRLRRTASTHSLHRNGDGPSSTSATARSHSPAWARNPSQPSSSSVAYLEQFGSSSGNSYRSSQNTYATHVEGSRFPGAAHDMDHDKEEGSLSKFFSRKRRLAA